VRTTEYSLPAHLDEHIELIQPTTTFHRAKGLRLISHISPSPEDSPTFPADAKISIPGSAVSVDASCNLTITVSCLKQLYNAVEYVPQATNKSAIAIAVTGYLEQFASFADLQKFYADQVPAAVRGDNSLEVTLVNGVPRSLLFSLPGIDRFETY
jgi:tripeptidyl-peptidase-1